MSIANVFVQPDSILLGVDTEGGLLDGRHVQVSKILVLPHISAAVTFRGFNRIMHIACGPILAHHGGFDELAAEMKGLMEYSIGAAKGLVEDQSWLDAAEFALAGFSPRAGRMVAHAYVVRPGSEEIQEHQDVPQIIGPGLSPQAIKDLKVVADRSGMCALARAQYRMSRERLGTDTPAGGDFYITEITRHRITTERAFQFPQRQGESHQTTKAASATF